MVGLRGVHVGQGPAAATPEVAAAHGDGHVDLEPLAQIDDVACGLIERGAVDAVSAGPANASPDGLKTMRRQRSARVSRSPPARSWPPGAAEQLADGLLVVLGVGLIEQGDRLEEAVETTLDDLRIACSGLPSLRVIDSSVLRSSSTTSAGTSSRDRKRGRARAMCTATSWAS